MDARIVEEFHKNFYDARETTWKTTSWLGIPVLKNPFDLWVYQEILFETRPTLLIETGTYKGGSALYFASIFDLLGEGRVITIDTVAQDRRPEHRRITYLSGSSVSEEVYEEVRQAIKGKERVMVVLDSDHAKAHVLREMQVYQKVVTVGAYMVVEDTNVNGNPVLPEYGPGPLEAVREFLEHEAGFASDRTREKFGMTFFAEGFLKRLR